MSERRVKGSQRRPYHSPKRAQQALATRRRIRGAAQELFLTRGYTATSINAIASSAGVALRTIFLAFPTKAAILNEIIQVALRGDDRPQPMATRAEWETMLALPAVRLLERFAAGSASILQRTARLLELGELAADQDKDIATFRDQGRANMRSDFHQIATALADKRALAPDLTVQHAADVLFALAGHEVYLRLTRECGWSPDQYTSWLGTQLKATLLADLEGY